MFWKPSADVLKHEQVFFNNLQKVIGNLILMTFAFKQFLQISNGDILFPWGDVLHSQ